MAASRVGPYDDGKGGGGLNLGLHVDDAPDAVAANRALLQGWLPGRPAWIAQVHGADVVDAATVGPGQPVRTGDASIATTPGVVCAILTADCLPVLFADLDGKVVGAAHAGWRGLAGGVLGATVRAMRAAGAGEITAWLGPAIGPACVRSRRRRGGSLRRGAARRRNTCLLHAYPGRPGKYLADMFALARLTLARDGVDTRAWRRAVYGQCAGALLFLPPRWRDRPPGQSDLAQIVPACDAVRLSRRHRRRRPCRLRTTRAA